MRFAFALVLILVLGTACSKRKESPGFPGAGLPALNDTQTDSLKAVAGSVGDLELLSKEYRGQADYNNPPPGIDRRVRTQDYIRSHNGCSLKTVNPKSGKSRKADVQVTGPTCDIFVSSSVELNVVSDTKPTLINDVIFSSEYQLYNQVRDIYDITRFKTSGTAHSTLSVDGANSGSFAVTGQILGSGHSKEHGDFQFNRSNSVQVNATVLERDTNTGQPIDMTYEGNGMIVLDYIFATFRAVLVVQYSVDSRRPEQNIQKYFINGIEVDKDDTRALNTFFELVGTVDVPDDSSIGQKTFRKPF